MDHPLLERRYGNFSVWTFEHVDAPVIGIAGRPFVDMEPFVDLSGAAALHEEAMVGLFAAMGHRLPQVLGQAPPEFAAELGFQDFESHVLYHLDRVDPDGTHRRRLEALSTLEARRRYAHHVLGTPLPWAFTLYLRRASFGGKTRREVGEREWESDADHFPLLRAWLGSLPFAEIGRVMFFCTKAGEGVPVHRDQTLGDHADHCINFWFDGPRPAFLWDGAAKTRIALPPTRAYFFNNRDYHGVEADPTFRYTLRVDGTFRQDVLDALDIPDGVLRTSPVSGSSAT